jgi:hypothetical protein
VAVAYQAAWFGLNQIKPSPPEIKPSRLGLIMVRHDFARYGNKLASLPGLMAFRVLLDDFMDQRLLSAIDAISSRLAQFKYFDISSFTHRRNVMM